MLFAIAIALAVAAGIWLRLRHLGTLGLTGDEGHQALAVKGVLAHGFPLVPSGRLYTRGLPLIYLQSASSLLFGLNELALRLPSVLFNLGAVVVTWVLGRRLFGSGIGLAAAVVLMLSVWEIETARHARMYTALQFCFVLSLLFFYEGFVLDKQRYKPLTVGAMFLAFTFHPIAISFVILFAIPFFFEKTQKGWKSIVASLAALFILCLLYSAAVRLMTATLNQAALLSSASGEAALGFLPELKKTVMDHLFTPPIGMFKQLYLNQPALFGTLAALVFGVSIYLALPLTRELNRAPLYLGLIAAVVFAFAHQLLLALITLYLIVILYRTVQAAVYRRTIAAGAAVLGLILFWHLYAHFYGSQSFSYVWVLWNYPLLYPYFATWFLKGFPFLLAILVLSFAIFTVMALRNECEDALLYAHLVILLPLLFASVPKFYYYSSRYVFHVYPIVVLVCCQAIFITYAWLSTKWAPDSIGSPRTGSGRRRLAVLGLSALTIMIASQDVSMSEARQLGEETGENEYRRHIVKATDNFYPYGAYHQDYKAPALFLKNNVEPEDTVVILCKAHMPSIYRHYSGLRVHLVMEESDTYGIKTKSGLVHYMTGDILVNDLEHLKEILENKDGGRVWLVADPYLLTEFKDEEFLSALNQAEWRPQFIGSDLKTTVFLKRSL